MMRRSGGRTCRTPTPHSRNACICPPLVCIGPLLAFLLTITLQQTYFYTPPPRGHYNVIIKKRPPTTTTTAVGAGITNRWWLGPCVKKEKHGPGKFTFVSSARRQDRCFCVVQHNNQQEARRRTQKRNEKQQQPRLTQGRNQRKRIDKPERDIVLKWSTVPCDVWCDRRRVRGASRQDSVG